MNSSFPSRQRFSPRLSDSPLNSREELWREEALLVACGEDYTVCRKLELVTGGQSLLKVDVNEDVRRIPHACVEVNDPPLQLRRGGERTTNDGIPGETLSDMYMIS